LADGAGVASPLLFLVGIRFGGWSGRRFSAALPLFIFLRTMVQASLYACSPLPYLSLYDGAGVAPHLLYPSSFVV
jgi:hypothetical protein